MIVLKYLTVKKQIFYLKDYLKIGKRAKLPVNQTAENFSCVHEADLDKGSCVFSTDLHFAVVLQI